MNAHPTETYISVDIEATGPIPGEYSMLSLGACVVGHPEESFYVELKPISDHFLADALEVTGFSLDSLKKAGRNPSEAMKEFQGWVESATGDTRPVFVGFNATYDWQFVNWYLHCYTGSNPFGFAGLDIKAYFMGMSGRLWGETTSSQLPAEFRPDVPQTHNALDDARAQASVFQKMLHFNRERYPR